LILKNTDIGKDSAECIVDLLANNTVLTKIDISNNLITKKFLKQV